MSDFLKIVSTHQSAKYDVVPKFQNPDKSKGRFLKSQRITMTEATINDGKKFRAGPGYYKIEGEPAQKTKSTIKHHRAINRSCGFIENTRFLGGQTPGAKYNINEALVTSNPKINTKILPKVKYAKKHQGRIDKIKVDKSRPAPGDYNVREAFMNTHALRTFSFNNEKLENFTDTIKKNKAFVPGAGHYKYNETKAVQKLSMPPVSVRSKR